LNSELLDLWYALRGKIPRDVWRNYEPKPMRRMPYARGGSAELEKVVRALADNRRALLPLRAAAPALGATVKDPWRTALPQVDPVALISALPASEQVSLRLDPELERRTETDGP